MKAAGAAAAAAQAKIDGIEEAAAADMKAAEAAATATERQRIADGNAERSLLGTGVRSARFELGRAGSENEFELDRQTLLLSIVAVHAAEDARIDDLMLGEIQVAALRKANDLDRDMAIERAIGLENTFTTERIENEMDVAEAAADSSSRSDSSANGRSGRSRRGSSTGSDRSTAENSRGSRDSRRASTPKRKQRSRRVIANGCRSSAL